MLWLCLTELCARRDAHDRTCTLAHVNRLGVPGTEKSGRDLSISCGHPRPLQGMHHTCTIPAAMTPLAVKKSTTGRKSASTSSGRAFAFLPRPRKSELGFVAMSSTRLFSARLSRPICARYSEAATYFGSAARVMLPAAGVSVGGRQHYLNPQVWMGDDVLWICHM